MDLSDTDLLGIVKQTVTVPNPEIKDRNQSRVCIGNADFNWYLWKFGAISGVNLTTNFCEFTESDYSVIIAGLREAGVFPFAVQPKPTAAIPTSDIGQLIAGLQILEKYRPADETYVLTCTEEGLFAGSADWNI